MLQSSNSLCNEHHRLGWATTPNCYSFSLSKSARPSTCSFFLFTSSQQQKWKLDGFQCPQVVYHLLAFFPSLSAVPVWPAEKRENEGISERTSVPSLSAFGLLYKTYSRAIVSDTPYIVFKKKKKCGRIKQNQNHNFSGLRKPDRVNDV